MEQWGYTLQGILELSGWNGELSRHISDAEDISFTEKNMETLEKNVFHVTVLYNMQR